MPLQYLLDEHVPPSLRRDLLRQGTTIDVIAVGGPGGPPFGTPDPQLLLWCEENNYVLVTNNRRSMPQHLKDHLAEGRHVPGIFVFNPRRGLRVTVQELILIAEAT